MKKLISQVTAAVIQVNTVTHGINRLNGHP